MKYIQIILIIAATSCIGITIFFLVPHNLFTSTESQYVPAAAPEAASSPTMSKIAANPLARSLDKSLQQQHFNGSVLMMQHGKTLLDTGYGNADVAAHTKNTPDTKHWIGSISKAFIGVAMLQLQEQGKLHIYDNVHAYVPAFPANENITLYELLTHTSGLAATGGEDIVTFSPDSLVSWIGHQRLAYPPGKGYVYSDRNCLVLAYIVQQVSGEPLDLYIREHILIPAGMKDSGIVLAHSMLDNLLSANTTIPNMATGYVKGIGGLIQAAKLDLLWLYGCGDMYTTTHDMYKFDEAIMTNKLISPESVRMMFAPTAHQYGFGFHTPGNDYYCHGVVSGWNTYNIFNWKQRTFVILFSNVQNNKDEKLAGQIVSRVFPASPILRHQHSSSSSDRVIHPTFHERFSTTKKNFSKL